MTGSRVAIVSLAMGASYRPTADTIREHLNYFRATAKEPPWQRADFSLLLLLGLRERAVDDELARIAPTLNLDGASPMDVLPIQLLELVRDQSIRRIATLVTLTFSALPLAWLTPTEAEIAEFVAVLVPFLRDNRVIRGSMPVMFASLCELARKSGHGGAAVAQLRSLGASTWLERVALCRAFGDGVGVPQLTEKPLPAWLPDLPPAIMHDPLTGLLSRSVLCDDPHRHYLPNGRVFATKLPVSSVIMLDVDRMKRINDIYGLRAGDAVLVAIAERLQALVGTRVIRLGGDEQLILWDDKDGNVRDAAEAIVASIRELQIRCIDAQDEPIRVTVSAGIATGTETIDVLHEAEDALHRAKVGGRDRLLPANTTRCP